MRARLAADTLLSLLAIACVGGSAFAYTALVGRVLGAAALGEAALALAIGLGGAQLATAGLAPAIARFTALYLAAHDAPAAGAVLLRGIGGAAALGLVLGAGVWLVAPTWLRPLGLPAALAAPAAGLLALQSTYIGLKAALYGLGRVAAYSRIEVAAAAAFAATLGLALSGEPALRLTPFLVANAVFVVLAGLQVGRAWRGAGRVDPAAAAGAAGSRGPARARAGSAGTYALVAAVGTMAALARPHLAVLATGAARSPADVGQLQAALAVLPAVLLVPRALELALLPAAGARGRDDVAELRDQLEAGLKIAGPAIALVAGLLFILGPTLLVRLYGPAFADAAPVLDAVLVAGWALGLAAPATAALSGADGVAVANAAALSALALSLVAWGLLVPGLGALGAALGLAIGSWTMPAVTLATGARRTGLALRPELAALFRAGALVAVALALTRGLGLPAAPVAVAYAAGLAGLEWRRLARWRVDGAPRTPARPPRGDP